MNETKEDREERIWSQGHKAAWLSMLMRCLREVEPSDPEDNYQNQIVRLTAERASAIQTLRSLCEEHGIDNSWPDNLNLSDIIEKYLVRHLVRK